MRISSFAGSSRVDVALYQRLRGNWRLFIEGKNLANRSRVQDENLLNGATNRRVEMFGRAMLAGLHVSF